MQRLLPRLKDARRALLIAPPGAGKTHCALHVAAALQQPVEVLVPTQQLVGQWRSRIANDVVALDAGTEPRPLRVQTYAKGDKPFWPTALVILDEAHHLLARWGEWVQRRLDDSHCVLGLTATPPLGKRGLGQFQALVGSEAVEIECAPLVKEGHLSPYLELVWPTLVEAEDAIEWTEVGQMLARLERQLEPEFERWLRERLQEDPVALTESLFVDQDGLLRSLCRVARARGLALPLDIRREAAIVGPASLHDYLTAFAAFRPNRPLLGALLERCGYVKQRGAVGIRLKRDPILNSRSVNQSKLRGLLQIIEHEDRVRGDDLRALVICERDAAQDRVSARFALRRLLSDEVGNRLDPVLVTGNAFWIDNDLWARFEQTPPKPLLELAWRRVDDHRELDVSTWEVAARVDFATRLLREGVSRCLVGTRHLLGEGWDCPQVNCVVDLTGIRSPVTVNQVRGRALRLDPQDPAKVATLWEVLVLGPGLPGAERAVEAFVQRHQHTLGLDHRGRIRCGADRVFGEAELTVQKLAGRTPELQRAMVQRLQAWADARHHWRIGAPYRDRRQWRLEGLQDPTAGVVPRQALRQSDTVSAKRGALSLQIRSKKRRGILSLIAATAAASLGMIKAPLALAGLPLLFLALRRLRQSQPLKRGQRRAILQALHDALTLCDENFIGELAIEEGSVGLDGPPACSQFFCEQLRELFEAIRYPRYLLIDDVGRAWQVPATLGSNRALADTFAEAWARRVGACRLIYTRCPAGMEVLREIWSKQEETALRTIEIWE